MIKSRDVHPFNLKNLFRRKYSNYQNIYNYRTGALQQIPLTAGMPAVYPTQDIMTYVNAFSNNASIYTIVSTIANKFGYIPRYLYEIIDEDAADEYKRYVALPHFIYKEALKLHQKAYKKAGRKVKKILRLNGKNYDEMEVDNDLSLLLKNPNSLYSQDSFFELQDIYYELTGDCFLWLNRGLPGGYNAFTQPQQNIEITGAARRRLPVSEIWVLPSQFMAMNINRNSLTGEIINYIFLTKNQQITIPVEDVIHWATPNPNYDSYNYTHLRGLSALAAGLKLYTADDAAIDQMVSQHQNGGAKGVLFQRDQRQLTQVQQSALDDATDLKINNRYAKGAVVRTPGDWGYLDMSMNSVDLQLLQSQDKMFSRLCNLYRVNPNFFLSGQTFDNLSQARKDFITQTEMPRVCSNRDAMNVPLLLSFGLDPSLYTIDADISMLPEMQDDMNKLTQSLAQAQWLTLNEKRKAMNLETLDDPNMDKIYIPQNLMSLDDANVPSPAVGGFPYGSDETDGNPVSDNGPDMQDPAEPADGSTPSNAGQNGKRNIGEWTRRELERIFK